MHPKGATKPKWPYRSSHERLFAAGNGQWAKKINGVRRYFGPWKDPKAALERYRIESPAYYEGDQPAAPVGELTVNALVNKFLDAKATKVRDGELSGRMYDDYKRVCIILKRVLGGERLVSTLRPADFIPVRAAMAPSKSKRANQITWARTVFKWGYDSALIDNPVRFGPDFKRPKASDLRKHKNQRGKKRMYAPAEVHKLVDTAPPMMKAMILLAINTGMGNTDCASLEMADVDLDRGVIDNVRHKTGFLRTAPLWPETVKAMREYLAIRPAPKPGNGHLFFLTPTGLALVRINTNPHREHADSISVTKTDFVADEFRNHAKARGIKGKGFYDLRHTFRTVAESGAFKERTISRIMGHIQGGIGTEYIHDFSLDKLRAVTDHVRSWFKHGPAPSSDYDAGPAVSS
jgi:integrase